jgi:hypothetical protein
VNVVDTVARAADLAALVAAAEADPMTWLHWSALADLWEDEGDPEMSARLRRRAARVRCGRLEGIGAAPVFDFRAELIRVLDCPIDYLSWDMPVGLSVPAAGMFSGWGVAFGPVAGGDVKEWRSVAGYYDHRTRQPRPRPGQFWRLHWGGAFASREPCAVPAGGAVVYPAGSGVEFQVMLHPAHYLLGNV